MGASSKMVPRDPACCCSCLDGCLVQPTGSRNERVTPGLGHKRPGIFHFVHLVTGWGLVAILS